MYGIKNKQTAFKQVKLENIRTWQYQSPLCKEKRFISQASENLAHHLL